MFNGKLKAEIASLKAQVNALVVSNTEKDDALAKAEAMNKGYEAGIRLNRQLRTDAEHTAKVLTEALNTVTAERDALRDAAAAKRAKQLANLTAANARRRAAAEQKRATH